MRNFRCIVSPWPSVLIHVYLSYVHKFSLTLSNIAYTLFNEASSAAFVVVRCEDDSEW
jgi:hypothetical protein